MYTSATALWLRCYIKCYLIRWVPGTTMYHTRPYDRTQYQSYVIQYITYVVRTRSTFYVLPSAEPSDIGCLQGADASATGFSEKACRYPSLARTQNTAGYAVRTHGTTDPDRPPARPLSLPRAAGRGVSLVSSKRQKSKTLCNSCDNLAFILVISVVLI